MTVHSLFPILLSSDLPRLRDFYVRALDGVVDYRFAADDDDGVDAYVSLTLGAASLGIARDAEELGSAARRAANASGADRVALWFYVDDVDATFEAFLRAGASSVQAPNDMPWGERVAQARDPDGNLVNLGAQPA